MPTRQGWKPLAGGCRRAATTGSPINAFVSTPGGVVARLGAKHRIALAGGIVVVIACYAATPPGSNCARIRFTGGVARLWRTQPPANGFNAYGVFSINGTGGSYSPHHSSSKQKWKTQAVRFCNWNGESSSPQPRPPENRLL